jgi:hypothetical protein
VYALGAVKGSVSVQSFEISLRAVAVAALVLSSSITAVMWSPMPWGRTVLFHGDPDNVYAVTMREIIEEIPSGASVAAHHRVTPHIAYRTEIYQFPNPFRLTLYGPDRELEGNRLAERADGIDFVVLPTSEAENVAEDFAVIEAAFVEVAANQFWVLYERDRSVALPGN